MRKYFLLLLGLVSATPGYSQLGDDDRTLSMTYDYIDFKGFSPKNAIGVSGEYMLGKHIGIEFSVAGGKDNFQFGTGLLFAPLALLLSKADSDDSGGGLLMLLLGIASFFEHTNYHIPLSAHVQLVPFVSLLKIQYLYDENHPYNQDIFPSWSIGTKLSFITKNNLLINATVERGQFYYPGRPYGLQAGITIGHIFKSKNE